MDARLFLLGAVLYPLLELLWRGRTHWSMSLAGGLCVLLLHGVYANIHMGMFMAFLCGALLISAVEFMFGFAVNLLFGLAVWDYSEKRYNVFGQVCLSYSLLWGVLGLGLWGIMFGL